jgi:hypothetical protein
MNRSKNRPVFGMNWKLKAFAQNFIASLPKPLSYELYYRVQRHFGGLKKNFDPMAHFSTAVTVLKKIRQYGIGIEGKIFFEVGTGRVPLLPVSFWLCGAKKTITVDLNPYMRNELIADMLFYVRTDGLKIKNLFGDLLDTKRFDLLMDYSKSGRAKKSELLKLCEIEYIAPCDAAKTD